MTRLFRKATILALCGLLAAATICSEAQSDTEFTPPPNWLAGRIQHDTTLTAAAPGPNYYLYGDVVVPSGLTLTIEPGVTLTAAGNSDFFVSGRYLDRVELIVNGTLSSVGLPAQPITFTSDANGNWAGVYVASGGNATFDYAQVSNAIVGVDIDGIVQANHCTLVNSSTGVHCTGQLQMLNSLLQCNTPLAATGSASVVALSGSELNGRADASGIVSSGGHLDVENCYIHGVADGIYSDAAPTTVHASRIESSYFGVYCTQAGATVTSCVIAASAPNAQIGLYFRGAGSVAAGGDSGGVVPTQITGYQYGVYCDGAASITNTLVAASSGVGMLLNTNNCIVNYCTIDGVPGYGIDSQGSGNAVYNAIITRCNTGIGTLNQLQPLEVNYSDVWQNGVLFSGGHILQGADVSAFDPGYLMAGTDPYQLANVSLFTDFSVSGGEIGAYGPGAGRVTPIVGASLLSAEAVRGVAELLWYVEGQSGYATTVYKRTPNGEWGGIAAAYADGTHKVAYEDRDVVPGSSYEYGLGVRGATGVDIQGLATVRIPSVPSSFLRLTSSNPSKGRALSLDFGTISGGPVRLDILDITGRQIQSSQLAAGDAGPHSTQLTFGSGLRPGIYWVRMVAPSQVLKAKFCVVN